MSVAQTRPPFACLVVEDSAVMRQNIVMALATIANFTFTEAEDGLDGLRKLAAKRFDIIVTDINMPIMDGLKLVKRVRTDPNHKDTPVIVITTETAAEDRQRAMQLGANAYLNKPVNPGELSARIRELLKLDG